MALPEVGTPLTVCHSVALQITMLLSPGYVQSQPSQSSGVLYSRSGGAADVSTGAFVVLVTSPSFVVDTASGVVVESKPMGIGGKEKGGSDVVVDASEMPVNGSVGREITTREESGTEETVDAAEQSPSLCSKQQYSSQYRQRL